MKKPDPRQIVMSPCQIVAWNLERARRLKGWTQKEAADQLSPYLGVKWSKATFSMAERSIAGNRIKRFDADEITAFGRAFSVPISFFLGPPEPHYRGKAVVVNGKPGDPKARVRSKPLQRSEMLALAVPFPQLPPPATKEERRENEASAERLAAVLVGVVGDRIARVLTDFLYTHPRVARALKKGIPPEVFKRAADMTAAEETQMIGRIHQAVEYDRKRREALKLRQPGLIRSTSRAVRDEPSKRAGG